MSVEEFFEIAKSAVACGYGNLDLTSPGGELFLHKDAVKIIELSKEAGFDHIGTFTNGIALHRFDMERLLSSGINAILISFPGFSERVYQEIYQVDAFQDFKTSIEALLSVHNRTDSKVHIIFEPRTYLTREQIMHSVFYEQVLLKFLNEHVVLREPLQVFDTWGGDIKRHDLLAGMRIDVNPIKSSGPFKKTHLCNRMLEIGVLANGDVRLCDCRYDSQVETKQDSLLIDNLSGYTDLRELLEKNAGKVNKIRQNFMQGKLPHLCTTCPLYMPVRYQDTSTDEVSSR